MANKPNIILIFPDQHRGDTMGCVGHPAVLTPNLDRLAAEGVTFTRCCTNSPLCMPARASLITGQYVNEHGVWNNDINGNRHSPSHVRNIRDAGYHTAVIGKTHLYVHGGAGHTNNHIQKLRDWGYEDSHETSGPVGSAALDSPYTDYLAEKGLLDVQREYMRTIIRGFRPERLREGAAGGMHPWEEPPCLLPAEDHLDMYIARKSAEWIRNYNGDKPFYLQICFGGPHNPFDSPAEYRAMYNPEEMPLAIMDKPEEPMAPYVERLFKLSRLGSMTESQNRVMRTYYYGKVTLIDDGISLALKALEEKGLLDNTWIIYTSDHGEMLGDHRLSHKIVFHEGSLVVPCIVRPPANARGWQCQGLTDLLDVNATLIDIAGAKPLEISDGRSLIPQIEAGPDAPGAQRGKEVVFSEVLGFSMVRNERYKMAINSRTRQPVELYDMVNDPTELRNLVNEPSLEKVRRELLDEHLSQLLSHLDETKFKVFKETRTAALFNDSA